MQALLSVLHFILDNYILLFELVGLLIMLYLSAHISPESKRLTRIAVSLLIVVAVCSHIEVWTQSFATLSPFRPFLTAVIYTVYPVILFLMILITQENHIPKKRLLLMLVPLIINVPLCFTTQWTHLVCWFGETNHYAAGPLRYLPYFVFGFYCLIFLISNILYFRRYSRASRLAMAYIVLCSMFGVLLTVLFDAEDRFCALFTSAIVLYYLYLYIHMAGIDPLTGLRNRQSYYQQMQQDADKITGVTSVDMNGLKTINDSQGHEAGDLALQRIAKILQEHSGPGASVYRVGGDEFMILYTSATEAAVQASIEAMRRELARSPYRCAFGFCVRTDSEPLTRLIHLSDERMYEDKAACKQAQPAR